MKKSFFIFGFLFLFSFKAFAFNLEECYKLYSYDADTVFLNALAVINSTREYNISEIQSKNGYILFTSAGKYFLLTVTRRYQNQAEVKILPQNSDYSMGSVVASDVFNLLSTKLKIPIVQVQ